MDITYWIGGRVIDRPSEMPHTLKPVGCLENCRSIGPVRNRALEWVPHHLNDVRACRGCIEVNTMAAMREIRASGPGYSFLIPIFRLRRNPLEY